MVGAPARLLWSSLRLVRFRGKLTLLHQDNAWTDLRERRIVGELRLLDIEGNDPAGDVRYTDLVKGADRNGVCHNHKAICDRVNSLRATRGRSIIGGKTGSNWRRPGVFIRGAPTFYKSPLDSSDLLNRPTEGVTRIQITVGLKVDTA